MVEFIVFACQACNRQLKVKPELAGKKIKCPKCGEATLVLRTPTTSQVDEPLTLPPRDAAQETETIAPAPVVGEAETLAHADASPAPLPVGVGAEGAIPGYEILGELGQGGLEIFDDLGGDDFGGGKVRAVFEALVFEPENVEIDFVAFD